MQVESKMAPQLDRPTLVEHPNFEQWGNVLYL